MTTQVPHSRVPEHMDPALHHANSLSHTTADE